MPQNVSKLIPIPSKLHTPSILSHRGDKTASLQQLMKLVGKNEEFFEFCVSAYEHYLPELFLKFLW